MKAFKTIFEHMKEKHPGVTYWGDIVEGTFDGKIISQKCQLCGEELTESINEKE